MKTDYFLFLDFETSGLDPEDVTLLEVAWTITNEALAQLTPLRSRFMKLHTAAGDGDDEFACFPTSVVNVWARPERIDRVVRDMHRDSGLVREWLAEPAWRRVEKTSDFDRLIFDDLFAAGWRGYAGEQIFLAGAGVSHFDRPVIDAMRALRVDGKSVLHYRATDTSSALQLLPVAAPKTPDDLAALVSKAGAWELLKLSTDLPAVLELVDPETGWLLVSKLKNHRAASDVAFSLVVGRCLRALVREV